jgi:hypothetical protein
MKKYYIFISKQGSIRKTEIGSSLYPFEIDVKLGVEGTNIFLLETYNSDTILYRVKNSNKDRKIKVKKIKCSKSYECYDLVKNDEIIKEVSLIA